MDCVKLSDLEIEAAKIVSANRNETDIISEDRSVSKTNTDITVDNMIGNGNVLRLDENMSRLDENMSQLEENMSQLEENLSQH
jgi:hypothetical protein